MGWGARGECSLHHAGPSASSPLPEAHPLLSASYPPSGHTGRSSTGRPAGGPRVRPTQAVDTWGGPLGTGLARFCLPVSSGRRRKTVPLAQTPSYGWVMARVPWWVCCSPLRGQGAVPHDPRSGSTERPSGASDFPGQPKPDMGVEAASWSGEPGSQQTEAVGPRVAPGPGIRRCPLTARALPGPVSPNTQDPLPGLSAGSILPRVWPTSGAGPSLLRCLLLRQHPGEEWWPPAGQAPPAQVLGMAR